ncbi:MAG: sugar phosphate nucleotidyltransferase [Clostridia bacterium]|nr:sugar phosphate nucleotidyltransferase [Clostridia bacterium]
MKKTALVMAGGRGERFWPYSRRNRPKQFLSLTPDGKTLLQLAVERILPLVNIEDIYVGTHADYRGLVRHQLPDLPQENILCEPVGRNTAPCIGLGAMHIARKHQDALMLVLSSDHLAKYAPIFRDTLSEACQIAMKGDNLVTLGIPPDYPETGYGYIKFNSEISQGHAFSVDHFVEKPDLETAKQYLRSAEYLWNSGMFIWKVSSILSRFRQLMPELYAGLLRIQAAIGTESQTRTLQHEFAQFESVSIDYGIMEKASNIYVLPSSFGWDDVGSWLAMERTHATNESGNVVRGNFVTISTQNCILQGGDKLIATVGLKNLIVVDTQDTLLICDKENAQDIKKVLENLRICNRTEYM